jgi:hypothetical protein
VKAQSSAEDLTYNTVRAASVSSLPVWLFDFAPRVFLCLADVIRPLVILFWFDEQLLARGELLRSTPRK